MLFKPSFISYVFVLLFVIILPLDLLKAQVDDECPLFYELIKEAEAASTFQIKFEKYSLAASSGVFCTQEQRDFAKKKQADLLIELDRIAKQANELAEENKSLAIQADSARHIAEKSLEKQESILAIHRANGGYEYLLERGDSAFYYKEFENALINYRSALVLNENDSLSLRIIAAENAKIAYDFIQQGLIFEAKPYLEKVQSFNPHLDFINENLAVIPNLDSLILVGLGGKAIHLAKVYDSPSDLYFLPSDLLSAKNLDTIKLYQEHLKYIPDLITELDNVKEIHLHGYELDERIFSLLSEMDSLENIQLYNCIAISLPEKLDSTFLEKKIFFSDENLLKNKMFLVSNIGNINFYIVKKHSERVRVSKYDENLFYNIKHRYDSIPTERLIIKKDFYFRGINTCDIYAPYYNIEYNDYCGFIATSDSLDNFLQGLSIYGRQKFLKALPGLNQKEINEFLFLKNQNRRPGLIHYTPYYYKYADLEELTFGGNNVIRKIPFNLKFFPKLRVLKITGCKKIKALPPDLGRLSHLEVLDLRWTPIKQLPNSIGQLNQLISLKCQSDVLHKMSFDFHLMSNLSDLRILVKKDKPIDWRVITSHKGLKIITITVALQRKKRNPRIKRRYYFRLLKSLKKTQINDNLTVLKLRFYRINAIPKELFNLRGLRVLDISISGVSKIPSTIGQLKKLRELDFSSNRIRKLPAAIYSLDSLVNLNLRENNIRILIDSFTDKGQIRTLDLSNNKLRALPESIRKLKQLRELDIQWNRLKKLPSSFYQLENLTELRLSNNKIKYLPSKFSQLNKLTFLDLSNNKIKELLISSEDFKNIESLDLQGNRLKELPISIYSLPNLKHINLLKNNFTLDQVEEIEAHFETLGVECIIQCSFKGLVKSAWQEMGIGIKDLFGR